MYELLSCNGHRLKSIGSCCKQNKPVATNNNEKKKWNKFGVPKNCVNLFAFNNLDSLLFALSFGSLLNWFFALFFFLLPVFSPELPILAAHDKFPISILMNMMIKKMEWHVYGGVMSDRAVCTMHMLFRKSSCVAVRNQCQSSLSSSVQTAKIAKTKNPKQELY